MISLTLINCSTWTQRHGIVVMTEDVIATNASSIVNLAGPTVNVEGMNPIFVALMPGASQSVQAAGPMEHVEDMNLIFVVQTLSVLQIAQVVGPMANVEGMDQTPVIDFKLIPRLPKEGEVCNGTIFVI